jgi:tyrosyl-tRNA synthetase
MVNSGLVSSKSGARRMIEQKGVRLNSEIVQDVETMVSKGVLQVGKRRVIKLT